MNAAGNLVYVGGLVGLNDGTITQAYATGAANAVGSGVYNGAYVGGLVGENSNAITEFDRLGP